MYTASSVFYLNPTHTHNLNLNDMSLRSCRITRHSCYILNSHVLKILVTLFIITPKSVDMVTHYQINIHCIIFVFYTEKLELKRAIYISINGHTIKK